MARCAPITLKSPSATASIVCIRNPMRFAACAKNAPTSAAAPTATRYLGSSRANGISRQQHVAEHPAAQPAHDRQREDPDHIETSLLREQRAGQGAGDDRPAARSIPAG